MIMHEFWPSTNMHGDALSCMISHACIEKWDMRDCTEACIIMHGRSKRPISLARPRNKKNYFLRFCNYFDMQHFGFTDKLY